MTGSIEIAKRTNKLPNIETCKMRLSILTYLSWQCHELTKQMTVMTKARQISAAKARSER